MWYFESSPALRNLMALKHQPLLSGQHFSCFPNNLGTANQCRFLSSVIVVLPQHFSIRILQSPLDSLPKHSHPSSSWKSQTLLIITNKIIDVGNADAGRWSYLGTFYQMLVEQYCIISCSTSQILFLPCCVKLLLSLREKHGSSQIWPERKVGKECGKSRQHQGFPFLCSLLLVSNLAWLLPTATHFLKCSFGGHILCCLWFGNSTPKYWEHCQKNHSWAPLGLKEPIYCSPSTGIG